MSGPGEVNMPEDAQTATATNGKEEPKFVLPPLDKGAKCFYDNDAKAMWVGIPVGHVDPFFASVFLDAAKLEFMRHSQRDVPPMIEAAKRRESLLGKAKEGVGSMMSRLAVFSGKK